ncbi:hypothetical protein [Endozoicomonas acroporae]|uniref:hypothetical protein n=1 Tax=Endozoicomonas acroporae TaxID=1701104 RepID=UPI003D7B37D0
MISNNSTFQPQFTNERLKQEEIIEREKDTRNIADGHASLENHTIKKIFQNDICITSVVNQVNKPENTLKNDYLTTRLNQSIALLQPRKE